MLTPLPSLSIMPEYAYTNLTGDRRNKVNAACVRQRVLRRESQMLLGDGPATPLVFVQQRRTERANIHRRPIFSGDAKEMLSDKGVVTTRQFEPAKKPSRKQTSNYVSFSGRLEVRRFSVSQYRRAVGGRNPESLGSPRLRTAGRGPHDQNARSDWLTPCPQSSPRKPFCLALAASALGRPSIQVRLW